MRLSLPRLRPAGFDAVTAAKSLFSGGGAFARYRGPAAILHADGRVAAANGAAWDRVDVLGLAEAAPLRPELAAAIAAGRPETITIATDAGALRLDVMPLERGAGGTALVLGHDIGTSHALNEALIESRARYKALVELSSEFAWETDSDGRFNFVSPQGALGYGAAELVGQTPESFGLAPLGVHDMHAPFVTRESVDGATVWWRRKDGGEACLAVSAVPIEARDGSWRGARGICRDVTEDRVHEDALARARHREDLLAHLVRIMRDAESADAMVHAAVEATARALELRACRIYRLAPNGDIEVAGSIGDIEDDGALVLLVTRAARANTGLAAMETNSARRIARPTQHRHAVNGVLLLERAPSASPWSEDDRDLVAGIADQLGIALAQADSQAALEHASRTDPLTGLLNRRAFEDEMGARLKRTVNAIAPGALLAIDLDNFKAVNDAAGHERGDAALQAVAALFTARTRPGDLVARLGGDEFALWLDRIDADAAAGRAAELVAAASELSAFSEYDRNKLGFSIGVAMRHAGSDLAELAARADAAMYAVKRGGKGGFQIDSGEAAALKWRKAAGA